MGLHLVDIYRSPNIGIFLKTNDKLLLAPRGLAPSKGEKLKEALGVSVCYTSIAGSRLLGPLVAMNNNGILVSRLTEDEEMREIAAATGMAIGRFDSKYTAVGNLIAANDSFALVSALLDSGTLHQVRDVLGTDVERMTIHEYTQVGALVVATNSGAATPQTRRGRGLPHRQPPRRGGLSHFGQWRCAVRLLRSCRELEERDSRESDDGTRTRLYNAGAEGLNEGDRHGE